MDLKTYMNNHENLPYFMKDFHDQKDLFKAIYDQWKDGKHKTLEDVSWVDAHIFTIDYFLWWMGLHGYKLQKIRKNGVEFYDPKETIKNSRENRTNSICAITNNAAVLSMDDLLEIGFEKIPHFTVTNALIYNLGRRRYLSVGCLGTPNEMLWIYDIDKNDEKKIENLICIHNWDHDGYLTISKVIGLINLMK